jgi:hypothetical protein
MKIDTMKNERIEKERSIFIKRMKEEKYNEELYSFFNGDTVGS